MRRTCTALSLLCLAGLAGCGSSAEEAAPSHQLRAWNISAKPFIPVVTPVAAAVPVAKRAPAAATAAAPKPAAPRKSYDVAPGAPSDAEVRAELEQLYGKGAAGTATSGGGVGTERTVSLSGGLADAPIDAPEKIQAIVAAANQVAKLPYVYGGGHGANKGEGIWVDNAYDCSASVSFALASAGLLKSPLDSTALSHWGKPGKGKWITIYANAGHAFMEVGGARFDTIGLQQTGSRWQPAYRSISGFVARHPAGL